MSGLAEVISAHLDPTSCSESPGDGTYHRWVRCRCRWSSPKSQTAVNIPDLRRVHSEHVEQAVLAWTAERLNDPDAADSFAQAGGDPGSIVARHEGESVARWIGRASRMAATGALGATA